jgi:probable O-glycosylation ligase (exosortase A-associated)
LLGSKFGLWGLMRGGAKFTQGFGGMLSDNNTMALAFAMAVPLCWFARMLAPSRLVRTGFAIAALLNAAAVVFTHSRGGALALGVAMLLIGWRSQHRIATALVILGFMGGAVYQVRDSFADRMATLSAPEEEASAYSRIVLAQSGLKLWRDYPLFGVGFTEANEQQLISNYVPAENAEDYAGKVLHNTYVQVLVDTGVLGIISYLTLLFGGCYALGRSIKRRAAAGLSTAIPLALQTALITYAIGSAFLSRTSFDFLYILLMVAAAWFQVEPSEVAQRPVEAVPEAAMAAPMPQPAPVPAPQLPIGPRTARERRALLRRDR